MVKMLKGDIVENEFKHKYPIMLTFYLISLSL